MLNVVIFKTDVRVSQTTRHAQTLKPNAKYVMNLCPSSSWLRRQRVRTNTAIAFTHTRTHTQHVEEFFGEKPYDSTTYTVTHRAKIRHPVEHINKFPSPFVRAQARKLLLLVVHNRNYVRRVSYGPRCLVVAADAAATAAAATCYVTYVFVCVRAPCERENSIYIQLD